AFSARAVAPILIQHSKLWDHTEGPDPIPVRALVQPGTSGVAPGSASLMYRLNGGATTAIPMTSTGAPDEYGANLPTEPAGTVIEYRIEAHSLSGSLVSSPSIAGAFHAFQVVSVFEPFESDGDWMVGDVGDDATTGAWERATPRGTIAAPYLDATTPPGSACFLTQNGPVGGTGGEADVDQGKTTLRSPVFG